MSTNSATAFDGPMDPVESLDFVGELDLVLEAGETINAGFTVSPTTESATLGLEIDTGAKLPVLETGDQKVLFWGKVNASNQADAIFSNDGVQCEVEIIVTTTESRTYCRTFLVTVKQL